VTDRVRVGVIGCGLIAQVQHLPNLRSLPEMFELAAVCDLDLGRARRCAQRFGAAQAFADAGELLEAGGADAVIICTSGDHAGLVAAAVGRGVAVLVEKPLCLDLPTAKTLAGELGEARHRVMVGYMRRYDEAFVGLEKALAEVGPLRAARARTAETAASAYLKALAIDEELKADEDPMRSVGEDYSGLQERTGGTAVQARLYKNIVLDSMVHELNMVQALAGPAFSVAFAELSENGANAVVRCERATVQLSWAATPGAARYVQELQVLGAGGAASVQFDSPYLPAASGLLSVEGGGPELAATWRRALGPAPVGPFRTELVNFHALATGKLPPRTSFDEALADIALCEAVGRAAVVGRAVTVEAYDHVSPNDRKEALT
jgi:predicted dehydrogenase